MGGGVDVRKILHLPVIRLCPTLFFNPQGRRCPLEQQDSFDTARKPVSPRTPLSYINIAYLHNIPARTLPPQTFLARLRNRYSIVFRWKRCSKLAPAVVSRESRRRSCAFRAAAAACDLCHGREHLPTLLEQFKLSLGWCVLLIYFNHMHFSSWI